MHTLWAKIGWVSIFLKNRFQIDANDLNLRVAKCIFSKSTPHQQYTRQQPSTSNAYLSTPMHTLWAKIGWVSIFLKNRFQIDANDLNLRVAKCIFSKSTPHQQYTRQQPSTSNAYLSTPMHTLWAKIGWVSIFLKNRFQIDANYLNLRVAKCIFSKSTPHQQYTRQQPSTSNAYLSTPMHTLWAKIGWVSIFLKNRFQIDANDLNLRVAKCIFSKSTPHQQYTRQQPSTSNAYLSTPMHTLWAKIGWVSIFLKNRFQIDANDLNLRVAKCIFSKSTPHQQYTRQQPSTSNAYLSTPMHTLWAKIGWVSIFLKNRFQIDARVAKCIFSKSTPHQQYTRQQPSTSNAYLSTPMHTLWAKIGWVSIFLKNRFQIDANPQFESCQMYIFKIYSSSTIHQTTTFNLKCIFVHSHAHPLSKNWLSQHIFKKQIPNWRKWPQFESCQMYIFKIYSSSTIHQTTTFNLKCIFVHSHAHPLSKNWLSQHIFKKQIPNWRKWPQFESCQMYIFKIYSSSTIHQTTTFNLKCIFVHSHAHPLSKNWLSQHIFKKQIPNWRKWPQFESCQMYIFKIYSSSTIHQTTTFNLKCIFVHSHAHPLSKNWLSQHIFKKTDSKLTQIDLNLRVAKCIFSKSTPHQQYTRQQPSTSNAYLSTPMHTLWAKIGWVSIFLKNRFQIDANDLNLRVAKCIFSKSTPHQQYTRQQPSTSNAYLSTPMHTLWAKIGWVSIFLKNRFQIDANYLNLRVAKCIFSKSTPHQQYTRQQPSTSNAYLSTPMHTLWAKIGWVSIFLKNRFQIDANDLNLRVAIWELPNVYFQNLLLINNTPDNNLQPQMHICPLPCTPFEQKLAESAYF